MPGTTRKQRVNVTQRDIDKAGDGPSSCPIYHALKRVFREQVVAVYVNTIFISGIGALDMPDKAAAFIDTYDSLPKHESSPFRFTLEVPA